MSAAPATRFVGAWELDTILSRNGLTRADWSQLVTSGAVPPPVFAWLGAAKWRRATALAAIRNAKSAKARAFNTECPND